MRDVILNITIRTEILDKKEEIDIQISVMNELCKDDITIDIALLSIWKIICKKITDLVVLMKVKIIVIVDVVNGDMIMILLILKVKKAVRYEKQILKTKKNKQSFNK